VDLEFKEKRMSLKSNRVVLVTGASRGVGKGIALELARQGDTVYVTGRSLDKPSGELPGTLEETVHEIEKRGGKGVAVACDHSDSSQIESLISRIEKDEGRLDILVNNVFKVPDDLTVPAPFWEKSLSYWDDMIDIGLKAHYMASYYAAPLMVRQGEGLMVNISSFGARCFIHTPVYGIGKAGVDKMAHDMGKELREHNVASLSLWLGVVTTERTEAVMIAEPDAYSALEPGMESPAFSGKIVNALASDIDLMELSGKTWITADLGEKYGITDVDGKQPVSFAPMLGEPAQPADAIIK